MQVRKLRRRCEQRLRAMELPSPLTVDALFADLARRRGRDIRVVLVDTPVSGPCALWVGLRDRDYVLVERGADPLHQDHMKLHEWAHIVCDHRGHLADTDDWTRRLLPNLDPAVVRRVLGRRTYTVEEEAEAEMLASLILTGIAGAGRPAPGQPFEGQTDRHLAALAYALEGPGGGR